MEAQAKSLFENCVKVLRRDRHREGPRSSSGAATPERPNSSDSTRSLLPSNPSAPEDCRTPAVRFSVGTLFFCASLRLIQLRKSGPNAGGRLESGDGFGPPRIVAGDFECHRKAEQRQVIWHPDSQSDLLWTAP